MCVRTLLLPKVGEVPCGKCPECRKRYVNDWYYRLTSEYKVSRATYFCTLTFNAGYVPTTRKGAISKHQLFMKRLRKKFGKFRFFSVLEYGPSTNRPHFHMLLFAKDCFDKKKLATVWQYGFVKVEPLRSEAGIRYTVKYMNKDDYKSVMLCSRRPFIGYHALERNVENYISNASAAKCPLPAIYKKKLRGIVEFEEAKEKLKNKVKVEFLAKYGKDTMRVLRERKQRILNLLKKKHLT